MNCRGEHHRFALELQTSKELSKECATTSGGANIAEQNDQLQNVHTRAMFLPPNALMTRKYGESAF
jgi:hypothetical protein